MTREKLIEELVASKELLAKGYVPVAQVVEWLTKLEQPVITAIQVENIAESITDELQSEGIDFIEDYTLGISRREIELESVDLNRRIIKATIVKALEDLLKEE